MFENKQQKSGRGEKAILTIAIAIVMVFAYLLYDDSLLFPRNNQNNLTPIGSIVLSREDVRQKNSNSFLWNPVKKEEVVYLGDSIFTGANSEAFIQLDEGSEIKLQPNSLIVLNREGNQMKLDFKFGSFKGQLKKELALNLGTNCDPVALSGE